MSRPSVLVGRVRTWSHGPSLDPLVRRLRPAPARPPAARRCPGVCTWSGSSSPGSTSSSTSAMVTRPAIAHERVEVAGGLVEDEVAVPVPARGVDEGEVGADRLLEHVVATVEGAGLLGRRAPAPPSRRGVPPRQPAVGDLGADARRGVEGGDAGAAGTQPLGEGALRRQLDLELAGQELPLELLVLADVGRRRPGDPARGRAAPRGPTRRRRSCWTRPSGRPCPAS